METTHGVTGFIHGIQATEFTGTATQTMSKASSDKLVTEVQDNQGKKITHRQDDQLDAISCSMRIKASGFTRPAIGAVFTIVGGALAGEYRITNTNEGHVNNGWADYQISAEADEYIDLTP